MKEESKMKREISENYIEINERVKKLNLGKNKELCAEHLAEFLPRHTHNSCAIEGNPLSYKEVKKVLEGEII